MEGQGTLVPPEIAVRPPDLGGFERAWSLFVRTVSAITRVRGGAGEVERLGVLAQEASGRALEMLRSPDGRAALRDILEDEVNQVAISVLTEEMEYYAWRYRGASPELEAELPDLESRWGSGAGDVLSDSAVDDAETVVGSIEKLLDKLPGPLKKVVHVLLEALKLTRGIL